MKLKIVIVILAVACLGLLIGLLSVKKQGEEQHAADASSIVDFSNQVADAQLKIIGLNNANLTYSNDFAMSQQQAAQLSNSLAAAQVTIAQSQTTIANAQQQITNLNRIVGKFNSTGPSKDLQECGRPSPKKIAPLTSNLKSPIINGG